MDETRVLESFGKLPLFFEKNEGQTLEEVTYLSRGHGYGLYLTATEAVLSLRGAKPAVEPTRPAKGKPSAAPIERAAGLRIKLLGGNPASVVSASEELPGKSNYFIGQDPRRWRTDVPHYARVSYAAVYPGVDLVYHGRQGRLEYDFVVSPGGDPRQIRMRLEGGEELRMDDAGNLIVETGQGRLVQEAPYVYQDVAGERRRVAGGYVLHGGTDVGFEVGPYDATRALVIDPILEYSTYLGGSEGTGYDTAADITVDASGSAYVTGSTACADFPTQNPYQADRGGYDVFVTKLSPSGSSLVYSTYLGGSSHDDGYAIAVDASGNAYVTGFTESTDFPTQNPYLPTHQGSGDAFLTKLSPSGSSLVFSTYLGGSNLDYGTAIAVYGSIPIVAGGTSSPDFPTIQFFQANQGGDDAFVTKFMPSGSAPIYSTYLGGSGHDHARAIAADDLGFAYVAGDTLSTNFPTANPYQTNRGSGDAFVTKISPSGLSLAYSTYLGGDGDDRASAIAIDGSGYAYVAGKTTSTNFPMENPYQTDRGGIDAFVTKLYPSGSSVVYSTYLGGSQDDEATAIAVDATGSAHVAGYTFSTDFPTLNPYQADQPRDDGFVTRLSPSGSFPTFSTYLGGDDDDHALAIAIDGSGNAYVAGNTQSTNFPTVNPYQTDRGGIDAFVAKLAPPPLPTPTVSVLDASVPEGNGGTSQILFTVQLSNPSLQPVTVSYVTSDGMATAGSDYVATSGVVNFAPGQSVATFPVTINGDLVDEANETFTVTLSNPQNATIADATGQGTIIDNDPLPTLGINDVSEAEGNAGSVNAVFTASLTGLTERTVTVQFATADDTATEPGDYSFASGTLTFTPGQTSLPITVAVNGDMVAEAIETFFVNLTLPTNAALGDGQGRGTILDDDGANFYTLTPCRVLDTRSSQPLTTGVDRTIPITGLCNVPPTARAVSLNISVTSPTASGFVKLFPAGGTVPVTAAINFSAGQTRANNGIYGLGTGGAIVGRYGPLAGTTHLILDVNGYFE